jgi:membrane-bound serine protease (ClpP class)
MKSSKGFSVKESKLDLLVGTNGVALTDLRPVGKISIEDSPYEASTEGAFIPSGSNIVVIAVKGNYLVVRKPH